MYQGYENHETWAVCLSLSNDFAEYSTWAGRANKLNEEAQHAQQVKSGIWTTTEYVDFTLADEIKEAVEQNNPLADACSMYSSLLNAALRSVNWVSVAQEFTEGITSR